MELKFCKSDVYFVNRRKNVLVATYNFGSVYKFDNLRSQEYWNHINISNTFIKVKYRRPNWFAIFIANAWSFRIIKVIWNR